METLRRARTALSTLCMLVAVPAALFAASATIFVAVADPGAPATTAPAHYDAPLVKSVAHRGGPQPEGAPKLAVAPIS